MSERRVSNRQSIDFFFNKYVAGYPHLCRSVDLSSTGILADAINEPSIAGESFPIEIRLPGDSQTLWLWGQRVRQRGRRQAIRFVNLSQHDERRIARYLAVAAA
jgi:hypothetical protein